VNKLKKLDYGSGRQPKKGFYSSDFCGASGYDYFVKEYRVLGAKSKEFDVVHIRNVIHHIPKSDLPTLFQELERVLSDDGYLIISEPKKEFHLQNKILDYIWYRFLTRDTSIMIPNEYVDFTIYLTRFDIVTSYDEYQNEIVIYQKKCKEQRKVG
jgi:SAM-dependent methyltransferase